MGEEKKERVEMLADSISPIWQTQLGGATLEQIYEATRAGLAKQGVLISRAGFLSVAGVAMITPRGMVALAKLGVEVVGFQPMVTNSRTNPLGGNEQ